jgi:hypothetical protein
MSYVLRSYYGDLFGWQFDTSAPVAEAVSEAGNYGFVEAYVAFSKQFEVNFSSVFHILPRYFSGLERRVCLIRARASLTLTVTGEE